MIQSSSQYFRMDIVLMGILVIGVLGLILQKLVRMLERRVADWQDTIVEEG